jgi:hypothetical protein
MCKSSASDTLDSVLLLGVGSSSEKKEGEEEGEEVVEEEEVVAAERKEVMLVMVFDHRVKKIMAFLGPDKLLKVAVHIEAETAYNFTIPVGIYKVEPDHGGRLCISIRCGGEIRCKRCCLIISAQGHKLTRGRHDIDET